MNNSNCGCRSICIIIAIAVSIIVGIVTGFLRFAAVITVAPAFLWVAFGIAVFYLLSLVFAQRCGMKRCICAALPVLLTGIFGTILTSLLLLAIPFAATSAVGAIITGLNLAAFSLTLTSSVCLIKCAANCTDTGDQTQNKLR